MTLLEDKKQKVEKEKKEEPNLKGTFIAVMSLGVFLVLAWVAVFIFFMIR